MPTKHGAYSSNDMGKDKIIEMDKERTRPKTVADGVSFADVVDRNSEEPSNYGLAASIKKRKR